MMMKGKEEKEILKMWAGPHTRETAHHAFLDNKRRKLDRIQKLVETTSL